MFEIWNSDSTGGWWDYRVLDSAGLSTSRCAELRDKAGDELNTTPAHRVHYRPPVRKPPLHSRTVWECMQTAVLVTAKHTHLHNRAQSINKFHCTCSVLLLKELNTCTGWCLILSPVTGLHTPHAGLGDSTGLRTLLQPAWGFSQLVT